MLLPWVGETPILTIEPIDDDPIDENIDILDDEPDANTISSISGKKLIIARDRLYDNLFWVIEREILEILATNILISDFFEEAYQVSNRSSSYHSIQPQGHSLLIPDSASRPGQTRSNSCQL